MKNKTHLNMPGFELPHMGSEKQVGPYKSALHVHTPGHNEPSFAPVSTPPSFHETFTSSSGGGNLDEFLKRVEERKITNPEYGNQKTPKQTKSYDFFITNRSPESDRVAVEMDSLNQAVMNYAKNRQFDELNKTKAYQEKLKDQYNLD